MLRIRVACIANASAMITLGHVAGEKMRDKEKTKCLEVLDTLPIHKVLD